MLTANIAGWGASLRPIAYDDLETIREWRNHDDVRMHMLNQSLITTAQQVEWFEQLAQRTDCQYFVICFNDQPHGVANIRSFDGEPITEAKRLEPGLYLAPDSKYRSTVLSFSPALALNEAAFEQTQCELLVARVFKSNETAIRFNKTLGYNAPQVIQESSDLVSMALTVSNHDAAKERLNILQRFK